MQIYLKGYYGYQNFGDELLLFGVIEEIFTRYPVQKLVIEVGDLARIKKRKEKNLTFISGYYRFRGVEIDRGKIQFFQPDERSREEAPGFLRQLLPKKRLTYLFFLLWKHPYRSFFKIFWGGEVIDEMRAFPHNGRNILLLYFQTLIHHKFSLRGGFWTQTKCTTRFLSFFLFKKASQMLARDEVSFALAQKYNPNTELVSDFSTPLLQYFLTSPSKQSPLNSNPYALLSLSPQIKTFPELSKKFQWYFFPSDMTYDPPLSEGLPFPMPCYDWTENDLEFTLSIIKKSEIWIGSRLHFLYACKHLWVPFQILYQSAKLERNLL